MLSILLSLEAAADTAGIKALAVAAVELAV
jgi:hypothetical protein